MKSKTTKQTLRSVTMCWNNPANASQSFCCTVISIIRTRNNRLATNTGENTVVFYLDKELFTTVPPVRSHDRLVSVKYGTLDSVSTAMLERSRPIHAAYSSQSDADATNNTRMSPDNELHVHTLERQRSTIQQYRTTYVRHGLARRAKQQAAL